MKETIDDRMERRSRQREAIVPVRELKERLKTEGFRVTRLEQEGSAWTFDERQERSEHDVYMLREDQTLYVGVPDSSDVCWGCYDSAKTLAAYLRLTDGESVRDQDIKLVLGPEKRLRVGYAGQFDRETVLEDLTMEERIKFTAQHMMGFVEKGPEHFQGMCGDVCAALGVIMVGRYGAKSVSVAFQEMDDQRK